MGVPSPPGSTWGRGWYKQADSRRGDKARQGRVKDMTLRMLLAQQVGVPGWPHDGGAICMARNTCGRLLWQQHPERQAQQVQRLSGQGPGDVAQQVHRGPQFPLPCQFQLPAHVHAGTKGPGF